MMRTVLGIVFGVVVALLMVAAAEWIETALYLIVGGALAARVHRKPYPGEALLG